LKYLFHLGHPAHFHLFKNTIKRLKELGHICYIIIKQKDVLEDLVSLEGFEYQNILPSGRKDSSLGIAFGLLKQDIRLFSFCLKHKPDLLIGSTPTVAHVGKLLKIRSIILSEDDAKEVLMFAKNSYPFVDIILSPDSCDNGKWNKKTVNYPSYHELAYLHPNHFAPDINIVEKYLNTDLPYYVIRFSKLNAYHDVGISGINSDVAKKIITQLNPYGRIFITSEKELMLDLEKYRISINPLDMHHILAFARIFIGDSQTMAAEAGILGTPFIRINDFVGRLGYLNEIENVFQLGYGLKPDKIESVFEIIDSLINNINLKEEWNLKRQIMLKLKIDFSIFLTNFLLNESTNSK